MTLTFYPTVSCGELGKYTNIPRVLLPASSWAAPSVRKYGRVQSIPIPKLSAHVTERAADCGGFVATLKWGEYKYTSQQYTDWLSGWHPQWAAMMDFCCEDEITSGQSGVVRDRQQKTTGMAYHMWDAYRDAPWAWVPTIQGWHVEDYRRHAQEMKPLITEIHQYYGQDSFFRVGIGTLCRRASVPMIHRVVSIVAHELPDIPLHLWGVKLGLLRSPLALPECVTSIDSAAWNGMFRTGRQNWKASGLSQRQYCFEVALPRYQAKIDAALSIPKQSTMLLGEEAV